MSNNVPQPDAPEEGSFVSVDPEILRACCKTYVLCFVLICALC